MCPAALLAMICLLAMLPPAHGDVPLPANVTNPQTATEAWNIINLTSANMDRLVAELRLSEVAVQASLCTPALRVLVAHAPVQDQRPRLAELVQRASVALSSMVQAGNVGNAEHAKSQLRKLRETVDELKPLFDAKTAAGDIYFCGMHPEVISDSAITPCAKCGMKLYPRRIPHSFVFVPPGEATMLVNVTTPPKLVAGQRAEVRFKLARRDGVPVMLRDLMVMHTQPIHLLIVDSALGDYHHEHPVAAPFSQAPADFGPLRSDMCGPAPRGSGEYMFSFTPRGPGPYRMFAELVPVDTGVQEYARTDLGGEHFKVAKVDKTAEMEVEAGDMHFKLSLMGQQGTGLRARQTRALQIEVTDKAGQPVTQLEPFMNAFAHLVGFYDDGVTVVHIHPEGGDILRQDVRGGPYLNFRFHPPKSGFLRLFCQVKRDGKGVMASFGLSVVD